MATRRVRASGARSRADRIGVAAGRIGSSPCSGHRHRRTGRAGIGRAGVSGRSGSTADRERAADRVGSIAGWQEMVRRVGVAGVGPPREGAEVESISWEEVVVFGREPEAPRSRTSAVEECGPGLRVKGKAVNASTRCQAAPSSPRHALAVLSHGREPRDRPEDERRNDLHDTLGGTATPNQAPDGSRGFLLFIRHSSLRWISEDLRKNGGGRGGHCEL